MPPAPRLVPDTTDSPDTAAVVERTERLIRDIVEPVEWARRGSLHHADEGLRRELQDAARDAGVFAPHVAQELGGLGLDRRAQVPVFQAAGRSLFGPLALNIAA